MNRDERAALQLAVASVAAGAAAICAVAAVVGWGLVAVGALAVVADSAWCWRRARWGSW